MPNREAVFKSLPFLLIIVTMSGTLGCGHREQRRPDPLAHGPFYRAIAAHGAIPGFSFSIVSTIVTPTRGFGADRAFDSILHTAAGLSLSTDILFAPDFFFFRIWIKVLARVFYLLAAVCFAWIGVLILVEVIESKHAKVNKTFRGDRTL